MCAGAELLLLPGCGGGLPDRLVSGSGWLVKIQIFLLYYRHPDFIGGAAGTVLVCAAKAASLPAVEAVSLLAVEAASLPAAVPA